MPPVSRMPVFAGAAVPSYRAPRASCALNLKPASEPNLERDGPLRGTKGRCWKRQTSASSRSLHPISGMQEPPTPCLGSPRTISFQGLGGQATTLYYRCRSPPDAQAQRTLTLQSEPSAAEAATAAAVATAAPDLIGLDVWPASVALCDFLVQHASLVCGASALELGAGAGLPGLLAAKLGALAVRFTDYEEQVRPSCSELEERNKIFPFLQVVAEQSCSARPNTAATATTAGALGLAWVSGRPGPAAAAGAGPEYRAAHSYSDF